MSILEKCRERLRLRRSRGFLESSADEGLTVHAAE